MKTYDFIMGCWFAFAILLAFLAFVRGPICELTDAAAKKAFIFFWWVGLVLLAAFLVAVVALTVNELYVVWTLTKRG